MDSLRFPTPAGPASTGLNALLDERRALAGRLADAERTRRLASSERLEASNTLAALERRAAGENVPDPT